LNLAVTRFAVWLKIFLCPLLCEDRLTVPFFFCLVIVPLLVDETDAP
jgi:hypothetical protein